MNSINRRVTALEQGRAIRNPVVIFAYGDGGPNMAGYRTLGGETVTRRNDETIESLQERAKLIEARQHPERKEIVLHELYTEKYWQDKRPSWTAELFASTQTIEASYAAE